MTEPSWRTVAVHGQPPRDDLVLIRTKARYSTWARRPGNELSASTRWIPITELETLPNAPTPPRTVTIEINEDDAQWLARWFATSKMEIGRRMGDAARDALARLDAEDSA